MRARFVPLFPAVLLMISCADVETEDVTGVLIDGGSEVDDSGSSSSGGLVFCQDDGNPCTTQPALGPDCEGKPILDGTSCGRECACLGGQPTTCYVFDPCIGVDASGMVMDGKCSAEGGCCTACLRESGACMTEAPPGCGFGGEICHACQ